MTSVKSAIEEMTGRTFPEGAYESTVANTNFEEECKAEVDLFVLFSFHASHNEVARALNFYRENQFPYDLESVDDLYLVKEDIEFRRRLHL